jgi:hypothetical protein
MARGGIGPLTKMTGSPTSDLAAPIQITHPPPTLKHEFDSPLQQGRYNQFRTLSNRIVMPTISVIVMIISASFLLGAGAGDRLLDAAPDM